MNQVLVVGGGPAGSSTAWHLAKRGLDVVLVDRAHFPRSKPCSEYISPEGARILDAMGALGELEHAHSASLTGMEVHAPDGTSFLGEFVAPHGFRAFRDRGMGIRRERLDRILLDRARAEGVTVIEGAKLESLVCDRQRVVTGAVIREGNSSRTLSASVTVGADGLRSVVSRRLGLARTARWPRRYAIVAHYAGVRGIGTVGEMHVSPDGYLGLAAVGDGITNVALVVPHGVLRAMRDGPQRFLSAWIARDPAMAHRFADAESVAPVMVTGPFASRAKRPWAPGVALVGDAADFFDPFTGEGIFAALRGGELAAPFIERAVSALDGATTTGRKNANAALREYAQARRDVFGGKWHVEQAIGLAVGVPTLLNYAARILSRDRALADLLVGVTGDFIPASAVLAPRTLLRFLWPHREAAPAAFAAVPSKPIPSAPAALHAHRP